MKVVLQRVKSAKVSVGGKTIGEIGKGYFLLLGVKEGDDDKAAISLAEKVSKLRVMSDENDKMNLNLSDAKGGVLVVSQFTLYADTSKGNRPSFVKAGDPKRAKALYELFIKKIQEEGLSVQTGEFGSYMLIENVLNGPVTIVLEA